MAELPVETVTFLVTDAEGATRLWEEHPAETESILEDHHEILRAAILECDGQVVAATGQGVAAVFARADDAVRAAVAVQLGLMTARGRDPNGLTVRIGLASEATSERDDMSSGSVLNRAARIMAAGHGGQILVGARTATLLDDVECIDLGEHRLRGLAGVEHVFQVGSEGLPVDFPPLRALDARRGNLPAPAHPLIGRDRELAEVVALARAHRFVTLTGVGGVGKTRLALEAGAALADDYPDGVWLVELAPVGEASSAPAAIATALGIAPQADVPVAQTVAEALAGRRILVVLDNCEHVVDAAGDAVEVVLARSKTVTVLATSREGLRAAGEHLLVVPPLALDAGVASAAVELFVERARAVDPMFTVDDATAEVVTDICRGLDGLALGIELAAARVVSLTPVDLLRRLVADRFRLLTGSRRQRSLREAVGWSYELLDDGERTVLLAASVFAGGFGLDAVAAVTPTTDPLDVQDHLDSLVRKSLMTASRAAGPIRYGLLETIRQFAENELAELGGLDDARDRHARHFADLVVARWDEWDGPGFRAAVDWVNAEFANLRAAFRWSAARGDVVIAADLAAHAAMIGVSAELFETVGWVDDILDAATAADLPRLARLYTAAGYACFTGRPEWAAAHARAAQHQATHPSSDPFPPGRAMFIEALAQVYSGNLDRYVELTQQVAALPPPACSYGLPGYVDGLQATGRVAEALALVDDAVDAARAQGSPWIIAYALWVSGSVHAHDDPDRALAIWREGLDYVRRYRVHFFEGFMVRDAALLKLVDPDPEEALALFDAAIDSFRRSGNIAQLTITLASVTSLFERIDAPEPAATLYGAITGTVGGDHHVPDLPELGERIAAKLGREHFERSVAVGATMDVTATALYAREQIHRARSQLAASTSSAGAPGGLSDREVEVLRLVAEGCTTRQLAERLFISPKTADHHIQHIYTKIGVSNRAAATLWAIQHDFVE